MNSSNRTLQNIKDIEGNAFFKNYIANDGANFGTLGWATYADAAGTSPVDGTGGSPNITFTRTTSSPLSNDASFLITKDAANRQGQGASYDFSIDSADKAKILTIEFDYETASPFTASSGAVGSDSDLEIYIYDVTNATLIPVTEKVITSVGPTPYKYKGIFQTSTSTSYRLILHVATTNASAWTFKLDNVKVSNANQSVLGAAMTDWTAYSMTINGVTSDPTKGSSPARDIAIWRRVGDSMQINFNFKNANAGTAGSGNYIFRIPSGYTIDTTKIAAVTSTAGGASGGVAGPGSVVTGSANARSGYVKVYDSTGLNLVAGDANTSPETVGSASAGLNSSDVEYNFMATLPIVGWSSYAGSVAGLQTQSQVTVRDNTSSFGSTNTNVKQLTLTPDVNTGSDITFVNSSTLGASFTINTTAIYAISYSQSVGTGTPSFSITRNATGTELTTGSLTSGTNAKILAYGAPNSGQRENIGWTGLLTAGDIIRPQTDGTGSPDYAQFTITKVANQPAVSTIIGQQEVWVTGSPGFGSSGTKVRRFSTTQVSTGGGITYTADSTNGDKFTVNKSGVYAITYVDGHSASFFMGITKNASSLTTNVQSLAVTEQLAIANPQSNNAFVTSCTLFLTAGDIIRAMTNGNGDTTTYTQFRIVQVA